MRCAKLCDGAIQHVDLVEKVNSYQELELRWVSLLLLTASHSSRSSPSGRRTARRRFPEPSVASAYFFSWYCFVPSGIFFFGLKVLFLFLQEMSRPRNDWLCTGPRSSCGHGSGNIGRTEQTRIRDVGSNHNNRTQLLNDHSCFNLVVFKSFYSISGGYLVQVFFGGSGNLERIPYLRNEECLVVTLCMLNEPSSSLTSMTYDAGTQSSSSMVRIALLLL